MSIAFTIHGEPVLEDSSHARKLAADRGLLYDKETDRIIAAQYDPAHTPHLVSLVPQPEQAESTPTPMEPHMSETILKAWKHLVKFSDAREASKSREKDLVQTRNDLNNQLDELGAGDTPAHLRASRDYVVTVRAIDYERDRQKTLADKMGATIKASKQENFIAPEDDDDEKGLYKRPTEADLFHPAPPVEPKATEKSKRAGKPGKPKPEGPDPSKATGTDEFMRASVKELQEQELLDPSMILFCENNGFTTIDRLQKGLAEADFATKYNCPDRAEALLRKAIIKYQARNLKASVDAEKEEEKRKADAAASPRPAAERNGSVKKAKPRTGKGVRKAARR